MTFPITAGFMSFTTASGFICRLPRLPMEETPNDFIMTDQDPPAYLTGLMKNGIRLDLQPFEQLLAKLQHPQRAYPAILVGGTNGKGSIAAMVTAILVKAGFRVGLYTSPHLVDVRERIRVNGQMISPEEIDACLAEIRVADDPGLTYFECLTAAAFIHFCKQHVDLAVLEVGMGGRLDATNVVSPVLSIISNVTLEHTNFLGRRLREIATEKAGIIREKGLCLTAATQKTVRETLRTRCRECGATLLELGIDFRVRRGREGSFSYRGNDLTLRHVQTALPGLHQVKNAALAIAAIGELTGRGFPVTEKDIITGLTSVSWPGRLETVRSRPTVILDGAHNPAAVAVLCASLRKFYSWRRLIVIFGVLEDKKYGDMVKMLCSLASEVIITRPKTERAVSPEVLLPVVRRYGMKSEVIENPPDALEKALAAADAADLICITGSLYLVGEIRGLLAGGGMA